MILNGVLEIRQQTARRKRSASNLIIKGITKCLMMLCLIALVSCQNTGNKAANKPPSNLGNPKFEFQEEFHNFGSLQAGEVVAYNFRFLNSGNGPLIIDKIEKDCGCLEVNFPQQAIEAGTSDFIEVVFNSSGETGRIYKEIVVYSNIEDKKSKIAIAATVENEIINLYSKN